MHTFTLQTNTFQCLLATVLKCSFVIFLYPNGEIQWTTGDDSGLDGFGGTEALAGINAGDGINNITIPGSLTPSIINITQTSNVGIPGVWMFQVDKGTYIYSHGYRYVATCKAMYTYLTYVVRIVILSLPVVIGYIRSTDKI